MIISRNTIPERENTAFIYSGLTRISGEGREYLKNLAQNLIALQSRPGVPIPDNIAKEIMRKQANEGLEI